MGWRGNVTIGVVMVVAVGVAACRPATRKPRATAATTADPVARGSVLFAAYCSGCHGPQAEGFGPVAAVLHVVTMHGLVNAFLNQPIEVTTRNSRPSDAIRGRESVELWADMKGIPAGDSASPCAHLSVPTTASRGNRLPGCRKPVGHPDAMPKCNTPAACEQRA